MSCIYLHVCKSKFCFMFKSSSKRDIESMSLRSTLSWAVKLCMHFTRKGNFFNWNKIFLECLTICHNVKHFFFLIKFLEKKIIISGYCNYINALLMSPLHYTHQGCHPKWRRRETGWSQTEHLKQAHTWPIFTVCSISAHEATVRGNGTQVPTPPTSNSLESWRKGATERPVALPPTQST